MNSKDILMSNFINRSMTEQKHPIQEAERYLQNARQILSEKAGKDGDFFPEFPVEQQAKQAHIYARYSNSHGKEGPKGRVKTIIIG